MGPYDSSQLGAFAVDAEGRIALISPNMADLVGYTLEDVQGRHFAEFIAPGYLDQAAVAFDRVMSGHSEWVDIPVINKDGDVVDIRVHATPDRKGDEIVGLSGMVELLPS